jgi:hypothetical protein
VLRYEMQVYRDDNSAGTRGWRLDAALIDYGSTAVPLDRGVSIEVDGLPSEGSPLESPLAR